MILKELRLKKGLTQQEVADAIGCSPVAYGRYEIGTRQPSVEVLLRLADLFGISVDCLLGRQGIEESMLSAYEIEMISTARESDARAREDAMALLRLHNTSPNKKGLQEQSGGGAIQMLRP